MRRKIWSLVLILLVAVCGGVLVACGQVDRGANVSLSVSSGLDSDSRDLSALADELFLTETEVANLSRGTGYDGRVVSGKAVTLLVGSEQFSSRDVTITINGWEEGMGSLVNFSSDSANIAISEVEYLYGGRARVKITGVQPGTAEITATSGQYSKSVTFTVRILELPTGLAVKPDAVIYLEKNSRLSINPEDYINFYPTTANMTGLEFYADMTLLTNNGKTTLSSVIGEPNAITKNTLLTVRSTRIKDGQNVQSISVRVVDNISQIEMKKLVYREEDDSFTEKYEDFGREDILTVVTNSLKTYPDEKELSYSKRGLYLIVKNGEENLQVKSKVYVDGSEQDIIVSPVFHEFITQATYEDAIYRELLEGYEIGDYHIFKFEIQYTGYDDYKVEFGFGVEHYMYANTTTANVSFKRASSLVEFRRVSDAEKSNSYTIYDGYEGVAGTRFIAKTNVATLPYNLQLVFDEDVKNNISFSTTTGAIKTPVKSGEDYILSLFSGENFFVRGNPGGAGTYTITARVIYTHDNITFDKSEEIEIVVQPAPSALKFNTEQSHFGSGIVEYNFDLNVSGKRINQDGEIVDYTNSSKTLSLHLFSYGKNGAYLYESTDFSVQNRSALISVAKDSTVPNKINITALATGEGSFVVVLGNNVKETFNFKIVESVSEFQVSFPSEEQNNNILSLRKDYLHNDTIYDNYLIAIKDKPIPTILTNIGDVKSISFACQGDNACLTYSNGYIRTNKDFERAVVEVKITYSYIDGDNQVQTTTAMFVDKILISSISNISNFTILTEENTSNFTLYDYSSVGHYSVHLAQKSINVRIEPSGLREELLSVVKWSTNVTNIKETGTEVNDNIYVMTTEIFRFEYNKSTGTGIVLCNINIAPENYNEYYDENGQFKKGAIILTGTIDRGDYGVYAKSIQFSVKRNEQIEVLMPSTNQVFLDSYSNSQELIINIFPSTSINQKLTYLYFPDNWTSNAVTIKEEGTGNPRKLTITLNEDFEDHGTGILRIVALDSAFGEISVSTVNYTKFIDIQIKIADGSSVAPYVINSTQSVQKMIDTNFEKYYDIHGILDLSRTNWEFNKYTLSGTITGKNAEFTGITIRENNANNNLGLFAEITGSISDIKISGTMDIENNVSAQRNIGLLAGENSGKIENVYVELNGGKITTAPGSSYNLNIGGVVGLNRGIIVTNIEAGSSHTRLIYFKKYLDFVDNSSPGNGNTLNLGGVTGNNQGRIERTVVSGLSDFNDNFTTAEVYIRVYHEENAAAAATSAIGGISGYSELFDDFYNNFETDAGLYGVVTIGEIVAGKYGNVFIGQFNNIGGLVGDNSLNIQGATAKVYVRGKNNVGGAVGLNKGAITAGRFTFGVRVEALESYDKREGLNASLIIGEDNIGGIIGSQTSAGSLGSSSFISYINREFSVGGDYFGDIVVFGAASVITNFGLIFGEFSGSADYVVGVGNIRYRSTSTYFNLLESLGSEQDEIQYAMFGKFINNDEGASDIKAGAISAYDEDTKYEILERLKSENETNFSFIILPPTGANIELVDVNGKGNELFYDGGSGGNDDLAFYLYYYESTKAAVQNIINNGGLNRYTISDFISTQGLHGASIRVVNGSAILDIGKNNDFIVKGAGQVVLEITTPYNSELIKKIYIYVINYSNNISIYTDPENRSPISEGSEARIDATEDTPIYFYFLDKARYDQYNYYGLTEATGINVLAKVKIGDDYYIIKPNGEIHSVAKFGLMRDSSGAYKIVVDGQTIDGYYEIEFIPYIEVYFGEKLFTSYKRNEAGSDSVSDVIKTDAGKVIDKIGLASLNLKEKVSFKYTLVNITKSISLSNKEIKTEPYYEASTSVIFDSLDTEESLTIRVDMLRPDGTIDANFAASGLKIVARWGNKAAENGSVNARTNVFSLGGIKTTNEKVVYISFRCEGALREIPSEKKFIVTFISRNNKSVQMEFTVIPQKQMDVNTTLYDYQSEKDSVFEFPGIFSYIPSSSMIPGQVSLIEFNIVPYYTNYAYIDIINLSSNEVELLFDLFNRTNQKQIPGAIKIPGGLRIAKSLITETNGKFYLRAFLDSRVSDNSVVSIEIILRDANLKKITGENEENKRVDFYVQHLPGVVLTVDGTSSGNTEDTKLRLARGLSYDMLVAVKGYSAGTLVKNGNIYTDGELVFEISGNANVVTIVKNNDGSYRLVVTRDAISQRSVAITTYGLKNTGEGFERSRATTLYLEIDEFVVKNLDDLGDIIKGVINDVYPSAIGNSYTFEVSLNNNILVYDRNSVEISSKVAAFLNSLSFGENVWKYQDLNKSTTTWASVVSGNMAFTGSGAVRQYKTANGVFTFTFNTVTKKFEVSFHKMERAGNPSFKFKFSANYFYENGVPTLVINQPLSTIEHYLLEQEFAFDISERTDLRNPYPIKSYEELMDMREGNYYILLKDIILPSDFKPITTRIGGLDGNNHKIILSDIQIVGDAVGRLRFGLFEETAENTILENIIIYLERSVSVNTYNYSEVVLGLLVGENYGKITNCAIEGVNLAYAKINLIGLSSSGNVTNEVGALVGINYGNITHCRVEVGISVNDDLSAGASYMPANLGGLTSINKSDATIASSYVNARVGNNTTSFAAKTGGVVAVNELNGKIFTTYIEGKYKTSQSKFADDVKDAIVFSRASAGAFVYENSGEISNCYTNIRMRTIDASSGFVFENKETGNISYCYSTSLVASMEEEQEPESPFVGNAANSAFVGIVKGELGKDSILNFGKIRECYYLEDAAYNVGIGSNEDPSLAGLLTKLSAAKFANPNTFSKFAFSQTTDKTAGVWFWPSSSGGESGFERNGSNMSFNANKPELVAPNIIATGQKTYIDETYDEATGITKYNYKEDEKHKEGTKYNPYIIATPEDMEEIKSMARNFTTEEAYYRIICDIIYETSVITSTLYKYSFLGNIEGNGFVIGNYILDSSDHLDSAGFFATIGTQSKQIGSIKNLTFAPRYISLTNASSVGALAGKVYSTTLVNIHVDGFAYSSSTSGVVILGKNCVGGVVGMAFGNYKFNEVSSNISVNSTYRGILNNHVPKSVTDLNIKQISFAGIIAGVLDGYGKVQNIRVYGDNVSIGEHAALCFGYVGKNVSVDIIDIESSLRQYIKADVYGGIVAGQNEGTLANITIVYGESGGSFFMTDNFTATAIGSLVGYMTGGSIQGAEVNINLSINSNIKYVGGAVGLMHAGELNNIIINGSITAGSTIGGLVGQVLSSDKNWRIDIADSYHNGKIYSISSDSTVRIGSIIGYADITKDDVKNPNDTEIKKINIIMNQEFIDETLAKIDNGSYKEKIVDVRNYVYSTDIKMWVGLVICKPSNEESALRGDLFPEYDFRGETAPSTDFEKIYNISKDSSFLLALNKYHINGIEVALE